MISIHRVARLAAKISKSEDSHWLELILTEPDGETQCSVTLYFQTRNRGFNEERRFTVELARAINGVEPMIIGEWGSADLSPIRETEAPAEAQVEELSEYEPRP